MATSLPIALNVRDGLKENYAYIALSFPQYTIFMA